MDDADVRGLAFELRFIGARFDALPHFVEVHGLSDRHEDALLCDGGIQGRAIDTGRATYDGDFSASTIALASATCEGVSLTGRSRRSPRLFFACSVAVVRSLMRSLYLPHFAASAAAAISTVWGSALGTALGAR